MPDRADIYHQAVRALRHDARNLLASVHAVRDYLLTTDDEKAKRYIVHLDERTAALLRLAERAAVFADMQPGQINELKLEPLVRAALSGHPSADVHLETDIMVLANEELTTMALDEVLDNAFRTESTISLSVRSRDKTLCLDIKDQGAGIAETALPHLRTPFRGAKRPGGTGLGLPIADRAMELQGGGLRCAPAEGGGTLTTLIFRSA